MSLSRRLSLALLLAGCVAAARPAAAAEGGFSATLANDEIASAGITGLTVEERSALDALVAAEVAIARSENRRELADTFLGRRTAEERRRAGLDRLDAAQQARLNELVAAAIAAGPKPRQRPRLKESDVLNPRRRGEIHGSVSLAYGWGSGGRDFRASSLWLNYFDPDSGLGIGLGISDFRGDGFYGYYPGYYPEYFGSRYYSLLPVQATYAPITDFHRNPRTIGGDDFPFAVPSRSRGERGKPR
ncbi:MAG: hypothetical protein JNG83_02545 [Opitutaceae bacterium]|nr:hypothetical protein [Opitutaceae bacterium]